MNDEISFYTQTFLNAIREDIDIEPPKDFAGQVIKAKEILSNDFTGLIVPIFEFMLKAIARVKFSIETDNSVLTEKLNSWLENINEDFRGQIPTGFDAFQVEYAREKFTSSLMINKLKWGTPGGLVLPTNLYVLDGGAIKVGGDVSILGNLSYKLGNSKTPLRDIYIHKDGAWNVKYPIPYLIRRVYANWVLKKYLKEKGAALLKEALILLLIKKGERGNETTYDEEDYQEIVTNLKEIIKKAREEGSTPSWATSYDTSIEHSIPDLSRLFSRNVFEEIDRDILSGMGMIDIVQGIGSTRRESVLNPKPLIEEVYNTVSNIKKLLLDILKEVIEKNRTAHNKYFSGNIKIRIVNTPLSAFWTDDFLLLIRSAYDRGIISKKDYCESLGFDIETVLKRRDNELRDGYDIILYPPIILNQEANTTEEEVNRLDFLKKQDNKVPEDKTNPIEKENFDMADNLEGAPYNTVADLPPKVKNNIADIKLQRVYLHVFNSVYDKLADYDEEIREARASKAGWSAVRKVGVKGKDGKWHLKAKYKETSKQIEVAAEVIIKELEEKENKEFNDKLDETLKQKKLELIEKQTALTKKLLESKE